MPLAFQSLSHGTVAFGFFNIDTDLLLLEHYFFFAEEFCRGVAEMARAAPGQDAAVLLPGYAIVDPAALGDLHGAICGIRLDGFIGAVYRCFPFPRDPEAFRQKPDGYRNRAVVEGLMGSYGQRRHLPMRILSADSRVEIGDYRFDSAGFGALIGYVWRGGYPRWAGERRPAYVTAMMRAVAASRHPVFAGHLLAGDSSS